jgi:hypothetical protein
MACRQASAFSNALDLCEHRIDEWRAASFELIMQFT